MIITSSNSSFSVQVDNSLLDPIPRIIQKGDIRIIDVDRIDNNSKKKNQIALESFRNDIRNKHIDDF